MGWLPHVVSGYRPQAPRLVWHSRGAAGCGRGGERTKTGGKRGQAGYILVLPAVPLYPPVPPNPAPLPAAPSKLRTGALFPSLSPQQPAWAWGCRIPGCLPPSCAPLMLGGGCLYTSSRVWASVYCITAGHQACCCRTCMGRAGGQGGCGRVFVGACVEGGGWLQWRAGRRQLLPSCSRFYTRGGFSPRFTGR